jgi:hypothetical protein
MRSSRKHLLRITAITCIGLAGSAVAALAQAPAAVAPPPQSFKCDRGEWYGHVGHGKDDSFVGGNSEPTAPSPAFQAVPGVNFNSQNVYDQTASDYHFGDTLTFNPPGNFVVTKVRLTTRLKPNRSDATNDGIDFASHRWPATGTDTGARAAFVIKNMSGYVPGALLHFDFLPSGLRLQGNPLTNGSPGYNGTNFFAALNQNHAFDMYVQDDTSVDFTLLEVCAAHRK